MISFTAWNKDTTAHNTGGTSCSFFYFLFHLFSFDFFLLYGLITNKCDRTRSSRAARKPSLRDVCIEIPRDGPLGEWRPV